MSHLTEKELEHWLRSKDNFDRDEAAYISEHLESCHHCRETLATLKAYYDDLERELRKKPGEKEQSIASKIYRDQNDKVLSKDSPTPIHKNLPEASHNSLPARIKNQLQKYPAASASITVGTLLFAALLLVIQPWQNNNDNPTYAEVERNVLHVYNQEGESIWNTVADGIPNEVTSETRVSQTTRRYIRITDVDGDDTNEVLVTGSGDQGTFSRNTLYCFNSDGTLRWEQQPPPPIMFGERTHSKVMTWDVTDFFMVHSSDNDSQLFATSNSSWFPSALFELNPKTGKIVQTYWHPGWISTSEIYENTENGRSYILLGTTNNTYQKAALAVLDPNKINGHAPLKASYKPEETARADEMHYIMFEPSMLNRMYSEHLYNQLSKIRTTNDGGLLVRAVENWEKKDAPGSVLYTLDQNFRVLEAHGSATFQKAYSDLLENGELDAPLTNQYWENFKNSVLYWDENTAGFISHEELEE